MFIYTFVEAFLAIVLGLALAIFSKKAEGVKYGKLDKAGIFTNILLVLVYLCMAPMYMYLGTTASPAHTGFLGIIGWVVSFVIASTTLVIGAGLGLSVALRKKGKSRLSFAMQFLGLGGIALATLLAWSCTGNLLVAAV